MSRIFSSRSATNNAQALAVRDWMVAEGWGGHRPGRRSRARASGRRAVQDVLKKAAHRCDMVVLLIAPAWATSKRCLAEFLLLKSLNKRIVAAVIEPTAFDAMPIEMTAEWLDVDLTAGPET